MAVAGGLDNGSECHGLSVTGDALCELDDGRPSVRLERSSIRGLALCHGVSAERPLAALLLGGACIAVSAVFVQHLIAWVRFGGTAYDFEAFALGLIPLGLWLIHVALRRRYFVRVDLDRGYRKLAFTSAATREEVLAFVQAAERSIGLPIKVELESQQ
jgi:hypothetical protein